MLSNVVRSRATIFKGAKLPRASMSTAQKAGTAALSIEAIEAKRVIAESLGFKDAKVLCFGTGAVTNTFMALAKQVTDNMMLNSKHAAHLDAAGIQLEHRGSMYEVPPGLVKVVSNAAELTNADPFIIVNGRQVGGNYDEIFDSVGSNTSYIVTAQNGQSSQALVRAAEDYIKRNPTREEMIRKVVGLDAAMFVKMSGTDSKSRTILQPGAKWLFGAYDMKDGSGTGLSGSAEVDEAAYVKAAAFVEWFKLLDADDGTNPDDVKLAPQAVSGKLVKTANNIGGNFGAAIVTRVAHRMSEKSFAAEKLEGPLPYGVLHPDYDVEGNLGAIVGGETNVRRLKQRIQYARELGTAAVSEFYDLNASNFMAANMSKDAVMEAAQLYWTELDPAGNRIPSKHPPTHALAMYERRPSEPLLDEIIAMYGDDQTPNLRELRDVHQHVEEEMPLPYSMKTTEQPWLETAHVKAIAKKAADEGVVDSMDLVKIKSHHYLKPPASPFMKSGLADMGEHAISYMERLGEFKMFYEGLEAPDKPKFLNFTIGGVFRTTPMRTDANASRGYVTHLTKKDKDLVCKINNSLGLDVTVDQVGVSPLRSKVAIQHAMGLFEKGVVVAHTPNYKATIDSARNEHGHTVVEVDVRGRYSALFEQARLQASLPQHAKTPIILLLVCPQNPCAIAMNKEEEAEFHKLVEDCPNISVIHDIAYQGYLRGHRDAGKRYRDNGMPHEGQVYMSFLSTSKSLYASGQPAFYLADKNYRPFLNNHYQRVATGPTSTFVHDLQYYYETLDSDYMPCVEDNLQKPMLKFIDENKERWGVDYLVRPDGPPFITLEISDKLKTLGLKDKGFRELTLRLAVPVLIANGVMRIALTGFDKSTHAELLPLMLERLDMIMSLQPDDPLVQEFKLANPFYAIKSEA